MSVTIETITIGTAERRLVLANAQWAATLDIGTDWETLRVGARLAFDTTGGSLTGTPRFTIGVMNAPLTALSNGMLLPTANTHFWGFRTNASTWPDSTLEYTWTSGTGFQVIKNEASVTTSIDTNLFGVTKNISSDQANTRGFIMLEIAKTGSNITSIGGIIPSGALAVDKTEAEFIVAMETPTVSAAATQLGDATHATSSFTEAFDEGTYGDLNSIYIGWDRTLPTLHISEMFFARMA